MKTQKLKRAVVIAAPLMLYAGAALAATSGLPADGPVTTFINVRRVDA